MQKTYAPEEFPQGKVVITKCKDGACFFVNIHIPISEGL